MKEKSESARERLVHHVQKLEQLEGLKKAAADAYRAGLDAARNAGYDTSTLKVVLRLRKMTPEQRSEKQQPMACATPPRTQPPHAWSRCFVCHCL